MHVSLKAGYPPLYLVNKENNPKKIQLTGYTKNQLFVIPENEKYPEAKEVLKGRKVNQYVIDKIVGHKFVKKEMMLLVKWAGFPNKKDWTYEPARNIKDMDVVKDYLGYL